MKILVWNCRGLGLAAAVGELRDLIRSFNPSLIFLCETKKSRHAMDTLKWSLGFANGEYVASQGKSGGLALLWTREIDVEIRPYSQYHMDAIIREDGRRW
jgi:exonuclease III